MGQIQTILFALALNCLELEAFFRISHFFFVFRDQLLLSNLVLLPDLVQVLVVVRFLLILLLLHLYFLLVVHLYHHLEFLRGEDQFILNLYILLLLLLKLALQFEPLFLVLLLRLIDLFLEDLHQLLLDLVVWVLVQLILAALDHR